MKWIDFIRANAMFLGGVTIIALMLLMVAAKSAEAVPSVPQEAPERVCHTVIMDQIGLDDAAMMSFPPIAHLVGKRMEHFLELAGRPEVNGMVTDVVIWNHLYNAGASFIGIYVEGCRQTSATVPTGLIMQTLEMIGVTPYELSEPLKGSDT